MAFEDDSTFKAVEPPDDLVETSVMSHCLSLRLSEDEVVEIEEALTEYADNVLAWSSGAFRLELDFHHVPAREMALGRWGNGPWVAPWNIVDIESEYLNSETTDFVLATHSVRDPDTGLHHGVGGCGGTYGPNVGRAGAGWSWIPHMGESTWFECASPGVYAHEWLHQVRAALLNVDNFDDFYDRTYPECGGGDDKDLFAWFPSTHDCQTDPDWEGCGQDDCGAGPLWMEHILAVHWPTERELTANHCRNGVHDFSETAVDEGGKCL